MTGAGWQGRGAGQRGGAASVIWWCMFCQTCLFSDFDGTMVHNHSDAGESGPPEEAWGQAMRAVGQGRRGEGLHLGSGRRVAWRSAREMRATRCSACSGKGGAVSEWDGMALAWFSQVIIAAERLTRAMRYALARRATCPGAKLSRACSRMLACGLCAIGCREAGVPVDHAGATRGVYPARCFHPGRGGARCSATCVRGMCMGGGVAHDRSCSRDGWRSQ